MPSDPSHPSGAAPVTTAPTPPPQAVQPLWSALALALAYVAAAHLSHALSPPEAPFVTFWLPGGCYLAALLLCPTRLWPWLVLAAVAANTVFDHFNGQPLLALPGFSLANTAEALTGAFLVSRFLGKQPRFDQFVETLRFVALAAGVAPAVAATLGTANVVFVLGGDDYYRTWLMWWTGDATGVLLLAPLILLAAQARWTNRSVSSLAVGARTLAAVALAGAVAWLAMDAELRSGIGLKYLAIPLIGFMALRFGLRSGLVAILAVGLVFALRSAAADAPSVDVQLSRTLALQFFLDVLGVTTLAVGALMEERRLREEALRSSQALLNSVVENTTDAVYVKDREGRYQLFNATAALIVGQPAATVLGRDDAAIFPPAEAAAVRRIDREILAADTVRTVEERLSNSRGETIVYLSTKGPVRDAHGQTTGLFGIARDITERSRMETALRESEALYRSLFENMLNGFAYCRMEFAGGEPVDFIYLAVNPAFERLTGLPNVVGRRVTEVIPGIRESDPSLFALYGRVARTGRPEQCEFHLAALRMWFALSVYCPRPDHFVAIFDVITDRKRAEEQLRAQLAELQRWQSVMLDREARLMQLKREINALAARLGEAPPYPSQTPEASAAS